jgi:UDP-N-acetylglucosamine 2-epimerase (non-hydrolysing)
MAPLVHELQKFKKDFKVFVTVTGQHREMLDQVLKLFEIRPDFDLDIMKPGQDLSDISSSILTGLNKVLKYSKIDLVLVHGDTTTSSMAALAAFYLKIPVGHVEAGLRTFNNQSPWPEELNRQLIGRIANYHFSPTKSSKKNLLRECIDKNNILVTGNTVIDALFTTLKKINENSDFQDCIKLSIESSGYSIHEKKKIVLITGHRRENFGESFQQICSALKQLGNLFPEVDFVYPMHLNPNVREPIALFFAENKNDNIYFIDSLDYLPFVYLMNRSYLILTDSGGIQEEAPSLGKPVLVMRSTTERPEAIEAGTVKLVGTNSELIVKEVSLLLKDQEEYLKMSKAYNPYGDGKASSRIVSFLKKKI